MGIKNWEDYRIRSNPPNSVFNLVNENFKIYFPLKM